MVRELYQRLREYFNNLPEPTEEERQFIRELNAGYFPITSVHRDDLEGQGFDVEKISDDDMQNLAEKMADDYCEQLFWPSMEIIAGEILSFPKVKTKDIICPKCNSENIRYDIHESRFHCGECSLAWDDKLYALVEFPEESAPFEEEGTGYPAWGSGGERGRFTCPRKTIYAIPANLPNGTSVTVPCVGRTPRNTWERKVVNPYRMKTGYGISAHRHTGCRCF